MAELLPCPFCGKSPKTHRSNFSEKYRVRCESGCGAETAPFGTKEKAITAWNTRTKKEKGADKPKITCLNCKHLMFSDMYGECNKQLRIVNPSDTCEYAEPKERGEQQ